MANNNISRIVMAFIACSCSLPILLMLVMPPIRSDPSLDQISFPGGGGPPHLRTIKERALMMMPRGASSDPLPPPPPLDVDPAGTVPEASQGSFRAAAAPLAPSKSAPVVQAPPSSAAVESPLVPAKSAATSQHALVSVSAHNEDESAEEMLARMSDPPAMEDVISYLDAFVRRLHVRFLELKAASRYEVYEAYKESAAQTLLPFDRKWAGRTMFPVRHGEGSVFISIASYRDHRLENTLKEAFGKAKDPSKVFVGVVMQNCFEKCKTGVHRVSPLGVKPVRTEISDAPPDLNGVADFCGSGPPWSGYCANGQVRLLTVREEEALGPCVARYMASKLWGGEEFFVQIDSHIWFVQDWEAKLVNMMKLAPSKRPVLSTYPPGYNPSGAWADKKGPRMCGATFSSSPVENRIIRIGASMVSTSLPAPEGTPIPAPYVAAGFFAAPSDFLRDLPFDPFLPWVFMGEEIMLSSRFFTNGYDIFAPRENILAHEYRPGSMGLPKFWETVGRVFGRPGFNTQLMHIGLCRVKSLLNYPECQPGGHELEDNMADAVLYAQKEYGMGTVRTMQQFLDFAGIDMEKKTIAGNLKWCSKGEDPPMPGWSYATVL